MASYPELRPENRPASAGRFGVLGSASFAQLALAATALAAASLALVFQLATRDDANGQATPGFLTKALGEPQPDASLVREPARGVNVSIAKGGYAVARPGEALSLRLADDRGSARWQTFEHGATRRAPWGSEAVVVGDDDVEHFLTVTQRQGRKTWRWRLTTKLEPRVNANGAVAFFNANGRLANMYIPPGKILDRDGKDVTPRGAQWSVRKLGKRTFLELTLRDRGLPAP